jgi:hypothetical protein
MSVQRGEHRADPYTSQRRGRGYASAETPVEVLPKVPGGPAPGVPAAAAAGVRLPLPASAPGSPSD